jgi:hypothetical protein
MIPAETELTLGAAADITAIAWAISIRTRYLAGTGAGTGAATALTQAFAPMLALTWAHQALMRILIP